MLAWIIGIVFALFLVAAATYFFFPGVMFNALMGLTRRGARLRLRTVEVDGHALPCLEGGSGEPLVLLHGFGANKDHWTMIARYLTPHFRVIAPDLPGFGDASRLPEASYALNEQIRRIDALVAKLGVERFHLGGNSMGGYLAAMYAARHPDKVQSVWLLAPAGALTAQPSELQESIDRGDNPLLVRNEADFDRITEMCFTVAPPMPARFKIPLLRRSLDEAAFNAKIFEDIFAQPVGLEDAIERCEVRGLVVWGEDDRLLHPSGAEIVTRLFPNAECRMMSRMGHIPMLERPAETAADWLRFQGRAA